jgi:hypothetical protein
LNSFLKKLDLIPNYVEFEGDDPVPGLLRISLSTTNPIESAISTARDITGRVRRWRNGH